MKNIFRKVKINNYTYLFLIMCFICGFIKNILIIFSICIFHELGHVFFVKLFKYKITSIEILPFGGYTKIDKNINTSINKDIIISLGGILFQIILFLILYIFKNNINGITYNLYIKYNIILIVFNMLPIIPLDGSKIIHLILDKFLSFSLSYKINYLISIFSLIIFSILNYIYKIDNYFIITFLIYKLILDIKNYKYYKYRFLLERYIYKFNYKKIDNNSSSLNDLKKEVLHYFKDNNKYINEKNKIEKYLYRIY